MKIKLKIIRNYIEQSFIKVHFENSFSRECGEM